MVSIIVPVYNRENVLEECINSVFAQTYQDFEVILIDDGSVDNTLNICNNLIEKDKRVKLITGEHGGVSNARNKGIDAAKGEYIFFLDSDDVIHPLLLEKLTSALESTGAGIGGSAVANIPQQYWALVVEKCKEDLAVGFIHKTFVESLDAMMKADSPLGCIGGVMMRTDLIAATRFSSDFYIGEDFYFIYENLIKDETRLQFIKELDYVIDGDFSNACEEIISRLDGLRSFAKEFTPKERGAK